MAACLASAVAGLSCGCALLPLNFTPSPESGAESNNTYMALLRPDGLRLPNEIPTPLITAELIAAASKASCLKEPDERSLAAPIVVPLLAAAAQYGFNYLVDRRKERIEEIVEAAQAPYAVTGLLKSPAELANSPCLLLLRYGMAKDGSAIPGLTALFRLETVAPDAFRIEPKYLRMFNAVALTKDGGDEPARVSASFAISVKAIGRQGSDIPRLLPAGEGVVTVPRVAIGKSGAARCTDTAEPCKVSDLIAFPMNKKPLSITLAVVEQGVTGFNDKAMLAELAAIREAFGPALAEAVKAKFGD